MLPTKVLSAFHHGYKTDKSDALSVAEAASRSHIKEAPLKELEWQVIQLKYQLRGLY